jgi:tellurite resistance-related uncharacterized protein
MEMPDGFLSFAKTPMFDQDTVPAGLLKDHVTKPGVWAAIRVVKGSLRYCVDAWGREFELSPSTVGTVVPGIAHHVEPIGNVEFFVEFYRSPAQDSG